MIKSQSGQTIGKIYMTFGEAINLKDYLQKEKVEPLSQSNLD